MLQSRFEPARGYFDQALSVYKACVRATLLQGDLAVAEGNFQEAIALWQRIESQNPAYLGLAAERLRNAYVKLDQTEQGLRLLAGYQAKYPSAELLNVVKSVSPNPAHDALTIKHAFTGNEDVLVRVMDIAGREIDAVRFAKNAMPNGQFSLNISGYTEGVYFLNFVQGGKSLGAVKFVKQ